MASSDDESLPGEAADLAERAWSVARLNAAIEDVLDRAEERFPAYVVGEISEVSRYDFGTFFELRDLEGEAVISCLAWSYAVAGFDSRLEDGAAGIVRASVDFYPERGDTQLVVSDYWPAGDSDRARELEALRSELADEGLLDEEAKRPLPAYPHCVGVVTSPSGSAREDFISAVRDRHPGTEIRLCGATVQGESAVPSLVAAIQRLGREAWVEVIVVTRGGGSDADLWSFNEEPVVRAIADCPTPVVVAVGHEDDETLAEAVADRRAMTPTDAGVAVTPDLEAVRASVAGLERRIDRAYDDLVEARLADRERRIETAVQAVERRVAAREAARQRAADLETRIDRAYDRRVDRELTALESRIEAAHRNVEAETRIEAGTAEARRLRVVVAVLVALLVVGTAVVVLVLL